MLFPAHLQLFGVTPDILPYAQDYVGITAFGLPFYILINGGTQLIRADRSPTYSMICMLTGTILNTILDPLLHQTIEEANLKKATRSR